MRLGIMQPYFLPYIGYWQIINAVKKYVIYDDVNFIKGGWINRNRVLMNGQGFMINTPLRNASRNKLINEIELLNNPLDKKRLLKTFETCYKKAPQYLMVLPIIENIINYDEKNLAKYLEYSIKQICMYLYIDTEIIISSEIKKNCALKGKEKVVEIIRKLGADEYINAIGGQQLYSFEYFEAEGIKLSFLKTGMIEYKQFKNDFIPNLSIIDVMMFNSVEAIRKILGNYELLQKETCTEKNEGKAQCDNGLFRLNETFS